MMKKRLVVLISFLLGVLVITTRLFQQRAGVIYRGHLKENMITLFLLVLTWGTAFITGWKDLRKK